MGKLLSAERIEGFRRDGFVFPIPVMTESEAVGYRRRLESYEAEKGDRMAGLEMHKSYLIFTWLAELVRHPCVLDAVEDVLGPDLLCFGSSLFIKEPREPRFISWHQDSTYWTFEPPEVVTAWIALSAATIENGGMRFARGTHRGQLPHVETVDKGNMLTRGQTVAVDESAAVDVVLRAGEMSLHHEFTAHASRPNLTDERRIGFAIRYIPTRVRQTAGPPLTAMLVRGTDHYGHFEPESPPARDLDPAAVAFFNETVERHRPTRYSTM